MPKSTSKRKHLIGSLLTLSESESMTENQQAAQSQAARQVGQPGAEAKHFHPALQAGDK